METANDPVPESGTKPPRKRKIPDGCLLPVDYVATELSVTDRHVRALIAAGRISIVRIGSSIRIPRTEFERIVKEGT